MAASYRDLVFAVFLKAAGDPEDLIRAASLSNLAELVQLLRHAIKPVVYEVSIVALLI